MKIIPVACPKCGASFEIEEGRNKCFCQYCGTQIVIDDGSRSITNTQIIRDEARIKEAETELEKKRIEIEIKEAKLRMALMKIRVVAIVICALSFALSAWLYTDYEHIWAFMFDLTRKSFPIHSKTFISPLILGITLVIFLIATHNKTKRK